MPTRDVRFGRVILPTLFEEVQETLGDTLETVGGGVVAGSKRPRAFSLALPLTASSTEADPYEFGLRARRQVRSLLENGKARLAGTYFQFVVDSEVNGWLLVGGGEVDPEGGITVADWKVTLSDCYRVATRWTHRNARRIELYDRRLSTTARDQLGTIFGTDFSAATALSLVYLPSQATDVTGAGKRLVSFSTRAVLGGQQPVFQPLQNAEVISFEQSEQFIHGRDDAVIYDRRGVGDASGGYPATILNDRPRAWWRFGEQIGATTAADSSDFANNGTYIGDEVLGATGATAESNTSVGFSQADAAYMTAVDTPSLSITGDLTLECWIKPAASGLSGIQGIISKGIATAYAYRFGWDPTTRELKFGVSSNGSAETVATSSNAFITAEVWQYVAVVYTASAGTATFYKNGISLNTVSSLPTSIFDNTRKVTVAKYDADEVACEARPIELPQVAPSVVPLEPHAGVPRDNT